MSSAGQASHRPIPALLRPRMVKITRRLRTMRPRRERRGNRLSAYRKARRTASPGRPVARPKPKPTRNALPYPPPFKPPEPRSIISSNLAIQTRKEEDVRHPAHVWTDPAFAEESLTRLR